MAPLLKALGMTIWGLIALGLLAVFIFVGYQAAIKYRPATKAAETPAPQVPSNDKFTLPPLSLDVAEPKTSAPKTVDSSLKLSALETSRKRFTEAAGQRRFAAVLDNGRQLYDAGLASPDDLLVIAHAFSSLGDCANAKVWAERANDALRTVGAATNDFVDRLKSECIHTLSPSYAARNTFAGNTKVANLFVSLGEAYYGFGDYDRAISSIQRGLDIGGSTHLDVAYVYLGESELKIGNLEAACRSFRTLERVPNIKPSVLKLWKLFADTHC